MISFIVLIYVLFVLLYLVFSAAGIYHLLRFGYVGDLSKPVAVFYIMFSAAIIVFTVIYLLGVDWSLSITNY